MVWRVIFNFNFILKIGRFSGLFFFAFLRKKGAREFDKTRYNMPVKSVEKSMTYAIRKDA